MTSLFPDIEVNGECIPHALVAAEAQNHPAPGNKPGLAWRKAARALAIRTLLLQEARRTGVRATPRMLEKGRYESDEEALIRELLEARLAVETPSDEAVYGEWARDPSRFRAPPLWEVSHILVACDPRDAKGCACALEKASELLSRAQDDPSGFARLADKHSDCESKSNGGFLGQIGPGDTVPEFETVLRGLTEGAITKSPVLTRHGYHIIRMDAEAQGAELPFDSVKTQVATAMEKAAWAHAARIFVGELVARAEISGADLRDAVVQ